MIDQIPVLPEVKVVRNPAVGSIRAHRLPPPGKVEDEEQEYTREVQRGWSVENVTVYKTEPL